MTTDAITPRSQYITIQGYELHYTEWGTRGNQPLIMWHGLARTGRDFDTIATALSDRFHIICPDTIGRGLSQWSNKPDEDYCLDVYANWASDLVDALGFKTCYWLGTSMGGSLGIRAAATSLKDRIDRLIINDIGPTFPEAPFERIKAYVGTPPEFDSMGELEAYFKVIYQPFGYHTEAQWRHMAETSSRRLPSGKFTTHYDPTIVRQLFVFPDDYEQWPHWDAIDVPTLVLHGVDSDLLLPDIAKGMSERGPKAQVIDIPGCGHTPALNVPEQIKVVSDFLDA